MPPFGLVAVRNPCSRHELTISVIAEEPQGTEEGHEIGETLAEVNLKFDSWKFVGAQGGSSAYARGVETILLTTILPILDSREETWTKEPAAHYGLDGSLRFSIEMSRMRALQIVFAAENEGISAEASGRATRADVHHFVTGEAPKSAIAEQKPLRAALVIGSSQQGFPMAFLFAMTVRSRV